MRMFVFCCNSLAAFSFSFIGMIVHSIKSIVGKILDVILQQPNSI